MPNVSLFSPSAAPTDWAAQQEDILRRRKMAEMLQQQALEPPQRFATNGIEAPISWTQGLAKILQSGLGAYQQQKLTEEQKALANSVRGERQADFSTLMQGMQGSPAIPLPADNVGPTRPEIPAGQINPAIISQLRTPEAQQAAFQLWHEQNKPTVVGRSLVTPTGKTIATDTTWAQEQEAERLRRQAELESKQLEAKSAKEQEQAWRDQQARQAAAEREALAKQNAADRAAQAEQHARTVASLRQPPPVQPLVQIMGPDNQPQWVERKDAVGKVPAGAGSKAEATIAGKETVSGLTTQLRDYYRQLQTGGGITDTSQSGLSNIGAGIASSGVGQFAGRMVGTQNQSIRNQITQQRPLLLNAIKQATGMSAKQMDSNAELKMYLAAATDPTLDVQANLSALDMIDKLYGTSVGETPQRRATDIKTIGKVKFLGFE